MTKEAIATAELVTPAGGFEQAHKLGTEQTVQTFYGDIPIFVVPDTMKVHTLEKLVEQQRARPYKLEQDVELLSATSFIEYYNRFASDTSTIFVDPEQARFVAVLDYHDAPQDPAWKKHKAVYACPKTQEWNAWIKHNNNKMSQMEFALFIEDNLKEIDEPNGAQMLEIAASLKANTDVDFKSNIRLDNGEVQFNYTETINGQAGVSGQLTIPEKIKLIIRPFLNGHPYVMEARFRYRVAQGGLTMWYTLIRPHVVQQDAVNQVIDQVTEGMEKGQLLQAKEPR